jgi:hypothetical protein
MPHTNSDIALVLKHAYGVIEEGWCQNRRRTELPTGEVLHCTIGALFQAAAFVTGVTQESLFGDRSSSTPAAHLYRDAYHAVLQQVRRHRWGSLSHWNDDPSRTKEEVLATFADAISVVQSAGR